VQKLTRSIKPGGVRDRTVLLRQRSQKHDGRFAVVIHSTTHSGQIWSRPWSEECCVLAAAACEADALYGVPANLTRASEMSAFRPSPSFIGVVLATRFLTPAVLARKLSCRSLFVTADGRLVFQPNRVPGRSSR
jgi:hypothetical protein